MCAGRVLDLSGPVVMGVLNVTPDSFSDGGQYLAPDAAVARALRMAEEGAAIIDIGGESTRPGAAPVDTETQLRRVLPVVERVAGRVPALISIDTSDAQLMRRAIDVGAHLINDVRALQGPGAMEALSSARGPAVCLVHMLGDPSTMQVSPQYGDVVTEVRAFLAARVQACEASGIARDRICVDPGFGFGKRKEHNVQLLRALNELTELGLAVAVGLSRKSLVASLIGRPAEAADRAAGSLALAVAAVLKGARIVRAHDVAATVDAIRVAHALEG